MNGKNPIKLCCGIETFLGHLQILISGKPKINIPIILWVLESLSLLNLDLDRIQVI